MGKLKSIICPIKLKKKLQNTKYVRNSNGKKSEPFLLVILRQALIALS